MGLAFITEAQAAALIDALAVEWPAHTYDLLRHNCCHFSDELCQRLGVGHVPAWVVNLAGVGAMLRSNLRLAVRNVKAAAEEINAGIEQVQQQWDNGAESASVPSNDGMYGGFRVGDVVEVFSIAYGAWRGMWLPARVESCQGTVIVVAFQEPRGEIARKVLQNPTPEDIRPACPGVVAPPLPLPPPMSAGATPRVDGGPVSAGCLGLAINKAGQPHPGQPPHPALAAAKLAAAAPLPAAAAPGPAPANSAAAAAASPTPAAAATAALAAAPIAAPVPVGSAATMGTQGLLQPGCEVEVFSNSQQAWCPGHVERRSGVMVTVAFLLPGAGPGEFSRKVMPADHADLRPKGAGASSELGKAARPQLQRRGSVVAGKGSGGGYGAVPAQSSSSSTAAAPQFAVGEWVETYSRSRQAWCPARVEALSGGKVTVAYWYPGAFPDEWQRKELPADHEDLRKRREGSGAPGAGSAAAPATDAAAGRAGRKSVIELQVGDKVEVFSNALQSWCPGRIESKTAKSVVAVFKTPGTGGDEDMSQKELPLGHPHVRLLAAASSSPSAAKTPADEAGSPSQSPPPNSTRKAAALAAVAAGAGEATDRYRVGDFVEVYSTSWQAWCSGRVTKISTSAEDGVVSVTAAFQLPGSSADEWVEKTMPIDREDLLRRASAPSAQVPGNSAGAGADAPSTSSAASQPSAEEKAGNEAAFRRLLPQPSGSAAAGAAAGAAGAAGAASGNTLDAQVMAEYLRTSGLPRKALKEVWLSANPDLQTSVGAELFARCRRLVAHCQVLHALW
eukprot:TRINITY_DN30317_c0_g1_i1.p1 TRINITY_DN30317_c0_g1~~TRINITY_DN30317_c0_g1_i1.p1  ORF type:complete len:908 (-),score=192.40 TRINITY_DN30317_c0_g1_i1:106-2472(-)